VGIIEEAYNCAVANRNTRHIRHSMANPYIVTNYHFLRPSPIKYFLIQLGARIDLIRSAAVGYVMLGNPPHRMIAGINTHMRGNGTEFTHIGIMNVYLIHQVRVIIYRRVHQ
jgi:hypothetical protein